MLPGRTTQALVEAIIEVDSSVSSLDQYIDPANELVTDVCAPDTTYSAHRLQLIETWLAAHFYCIFDPRTKSEGVGSISASYEGSTGLMLQATRYGQQAMLLDTGGYLSAMSKQMEQGKRRRRVGVIWLGQRQSRGSSGFEVFPSSEMNAELNAIDVDDGAT